MDGQGWRNWNRRIKGSEGEREVWDGICGGTNKTKGHLRGYMEA